METAASPRDGVAAAAVAHLRQLLVVTSSGILLRPLIALDIMFQKPSQDPLIWSFYLDQQ